MNPRNLKIKTITKRNQHPRKSVLPTLEKSKVASTPGLSIIFDDDDILSVIDKHQFGRTLSVTEEGIFMVRLGVFHASDKGSLEEDAICCTIPSKADSTQQITAIFNIPKTSARFLDTVILKAARPFSIKPVPGSLILERHGYPLGIPLKYDSVREDDMTVLVRTGLRKNVPRQFKAYFDVLSIQIEVMFVN